MKYYVIFLTVIAVFMGCKPSEKLQRSRALQFYAAHPGELAAKCAEEYPVVDSIGETVTDSSRPANNPDLSGALDSVAAVADQLRHQLAADTTAIARRYSTQISSITAQVAQLARQYKPCEPEIRYQTKTVYRENTARVAALQTDTDSLSRSLAVSQDREAKALKRAENAEKQSKARLYWILALIAGLVAGIVLRFKSIL